MIIMIVFSLKSTQKKLLVAVYWNQTVFGINHVLIYSILWCSMLPSCLCCTLGMDATSMCRIIVFPIETEFVPKCFLLVYMWHRAIRMTSEYLYVMCFISLN